jgi:hypothetical protein
MKHFVVNKTFRLPSAGKIPNINNVFFNHTGSLALLQRRWH